MYCLNISITREISQIRAHRLGSSPPQLDRYAPFVFYRALGSAFPSLVDFHRRLVLTHVVVRFQQGRCRSSFSVENSHSSETRTQETFHQEYYSYPLSHMTIVTCKLLIPSFCTMIILSWYFYCLQYTNLSQLIRLPFIL